MKLIGKMMKIEYLFSSWYTTVRNKIVSEQLTGAEFIPFIQPIYQNQNLAGGEVLLRVKKNGTLYTPESYLSVLESGDVINDVTCGLLRSVKEHFTLYMNILPEGFFFSFNICPKQLNSPQVIEAVKEFNAHFRGRISVTLEIVERGTMVLDDFAIETMQQLTDAGVRFAIDDFGNGSSCLKYIEHTGFSTIKIDKCLTVASNGSLIYSAIIDSIVSLAERLHIQIVAEGIGNNEQLSLLHEKGIHVFQGFLFSKPVSMHEFCARI